MTGVRDWLMGKDGDNSLTLWFQKGKLLLHMGDFIMSYSSVPGHARLLVPMQTPKRRASGGAQAGPLCSSLADDVAGAMQVCYEHTALPVQPWPLGHLRVVGTVPTLT